MKRFLQFLFIALFAFITSCTKDKRITPSSVSFNYFPTEQGRFVVFNVDSIVHRSDDNDNDDSISYYHFQLKYQVDSSFEDLEGRKRQVVLCYYKDSTMDWTLRNVWSQLLTSSSAYFYEDNVPYHKLAFPINSTIRWDGNDQNIDEEELYQYEDIHSSTDLTSDDYFGNVTNIHFDSTITVLQRDDVYFIGSIYGKEVYAENVGMIYHQRDDLDFNGSGHISTGTEYKMTAIDYGPR